MNLDLDRTYVTSDHHFFSWNMPRPFAICTEKLQNELIEKWNDTVKISDTVVYVGDFSDGTIIETTELLYRLKGNILFVKGNHDLFADEIYDCMFRNHYERLVDEKNKLIFSHCPECDLDDYKNLFGHIHEESIDYPTVTLNSFCVSVMRHAGYPVKLADALKQMNSFQKS